MSTVVSDCFTIGSIVRTRTCYNEDIEGEVLAFDPQTKMLILKCPSSSGNPKRHDVNIVNLSLVSDVQIKKEVTTVPEPPASLNLHRLNTRVRNSIENKRRLVLTSIRLMADGSYQRGTGQDHGLAIAQTTVSKYLTQVTGAIIGILMPKWIIFPGEENARVNVADAFKEKFGLPDILGAIDCTHVDIFPPPFPVGVQYKNRKGRTSLNVQLVSALSACLDPEGQRLFLAIARVIDDVSWSGQNIRVYNEVLITPPYKVENVLGEKDSKPYNYIRKFVERHWRDHRDPAPRHQ